MKITVNARNRGYEFSGTGDRPVLLSGLAAGVNLPYECVTGTCGTCRARLLRGEAQDRWLAAPGRQALKSSGEYLLCQCVPTTDCDFEVGSFVYAADPSECVPTDGFGTVTGIRPLTHDVVQVSVELEHPLDFDAGQFVTLETVHVPGPRAYSMVNFDRQAQTLCFVIKKKPGGGWSNWLFDHSSALVGERLAVVGPFGKAIFYPGLGRNLLCIAGGSGIAGIMSILTRAAAEGYFKQFRGDVFFGVRTPGDAFYLEELSALAQRFPEQVSITIAFSEAAPERQHEQAFPSLKFDQGLVHEAASRGQYTNYRAYLAGPPPAVDAAIRALIIGSKVTTDNIVYDKFS